MPVSHHRHIVPVMSAVDKVENAKSYLDIGIGFGKYGVLLRERYDVRFKRYKRREWKIVIDGIEIWSDYISPMHKYVYSNIYIGDVTKIINDGIRNYDVILALEILEHLDKESGKELAKKLYDKCNKLLIISFPRTFNGREGSDWSNPYELHRCLWTHEELSKLIGEVTILSPTIFCRFK